jgi:hypothetical protein
MTIAARRKLQERERGEQEACRYDGARHLKKK